MHQPTVHGRAQAARPGLGDELVLRHCGKASTAARLMDKAVAWLEQRQLQAVRPPMVLAREVVAAAGEPPATVEPETVAPAVTDVVPPVAEAVVAAPVAQVQVEGTGWVAKRWQELKAKVGVGRS
jgi:hypothetical protein